MEVRAAVADAKPPPRGDPNGGNRFDIPRKGQSAAQPSWHTRATNGAGGMSAIIDPDRSACLCDVGAPGYLAAVAVGPDGTERFDIAARITHRCGRPTRTGRPCIFHRDRTSP